MKFGLFVGAKQPAEGVENAGREYWDLVDYIVLAEELGFESVFTVEHHFTGLGQISAALNLHCFLAARTSRIRLGTAVVVLPWHNPALLAEQIATLDLLSNGRFEFGVGKGYRQEEFTRFCIQQEEAEGRFEETVAFLRKAFTAKQRFSHHGKYWHFEDILIDPKPVQSPYPPFWLGAGNPESIRRAAREDWKLLLDQIGSTSTTLERVKIYRSERERVGLPFSPDMVGLTRGFHIVSNEEERSQALGVRAGLLARLGALRLPGLAAGEGNHSEPSHSDLRTAAENSGLIGTPEQIVKSLKDFQAGGVGRVLLLDATGSKEALRQFAREVMPEFRDAFPVENKRAVGAGR